MKHNSDPFKVMFDVFKSEEQLPEVLDKIPVYMFNRWLSGSYRTIFDANLFNTHKIPPKVSWIYINEKYKYEKRKPFLKFPKKVKDNSETEKILMTHFKINKQKAKEYLELLPEAEVTEIVNIYTAETGVR